MPNEQQYPTMRFMKCKKCGAVFAAPPGGPTECPECSSAATGAFRPDGEVEPPAAGRR
jgi:predicted Zn-ribbon and HTH transcriptional regulator